jgi:hypothetical protein
VHARNPPKILTESCPSLRCHLPSPSGTDPLRGHFWYLIRFPDSIERHVDRPPTVSEETMPYFARLWGRDSRRRRSTAVRSMLEPLEGRVALSAATPTVQVPTTTVLAVSQTTIETAQEVTLVATVDNANHPVPVTTGKVKFVVQSPKKEVLGSIKLNNEGEAGITTAKFNKVGVYQVTAQYIPPSSGFSPSFATPVHITADPLVVSSFLVTPHTRMSHTGTGITVTVTALNAKKQPVTNYSGTVTFSSPTDSSTIFPRAVYASLHISPPSPLIAGLAAFDMQSYTFTPADHGSHTFVGLVEFGKGGAETLKVSQANNSKVFGIATVAIA